ncbi:receptor-interacting serine/threonine-protein kinase 3 isoform 2-T2 [Anomaloglossus baeobatrachus]|uniref:receptor-interacting serine/threonine-protein kinase 3 n=1 Tax=Anomaloglossus baeobatrachus TaxID=238106 RepID=UPI003F506F0B
MSKNKVVPTSSLIDWKLIDIGHFGSVYKAKSIDFKEHVAVKKLNRNVLQGIKELLSEAEKMDSASASPYVIRMFGIMGEHSPEPGIVMEYMEYGSLCTLLERVIPIPWALKFRIIREVTLGMNWLHNLTPPLLHLDLKTKNVLLNEGLHIKITDFGLSKFKSSSSTQGTEDCEGVGGTLEYMPPEAFQEGYQPSTSTDVYSFAILSAVVLRGQSPYPVDKSALIRELVPRGQRPCLKVLEEETSVKDLSVAIGITKRCWDNDKLNRPPFSECCNIWEKIFTAYSKCDIKQAVRKVQDEIDSSGLCAKTTDVSHSGQSVSLNTKDVSEMRHKIHNLNISEEAPALLGAVPPNMQNTSTSVRPKTVSQVHVGGAMVSNSRPHTPNYAGSMTVTSSFRMPSQHARFPSETQRYPTGSMRYNYRPPPPPQGYQQFGNQSFYRYPITTPQPYLNFQQPLQSKSSTINISGCSNFQIGDNSTLNVTDNSPSAPYRYIYSPQAYVGGSHNAAPVISQPPKKTTQGYYNTPERKASTDQPSKQETVKSNQQSQTLPVQTIPVGRSSNARTIQEVTEVCAPQKNAPQKNPPQKNSQ